MSHSHGGQNQQMNTGHGHGAHGGGCSHNHGHQGGTNHSHGASNSHGGGDHSGCNHGPGAAGGHAHGHGHGQNQAQGVPNQGGEHVHGPGCSHGMPKMTLYQQAKMKYESIESQIYLYSWQVVGSLSLKVEKKFQDWGYEWDQRQKFFFVRGAYPFYILSSFFLLSYFYFLTPQSYVNEWSTLYYSTFILKFLLSFYLVFSQPKFVERDENIEKYIRECRMDLQRFRCPYDNMFSIFRAWHCQHCKRCTTKYEKHSYLMNRCISAKNLPHYYLHIVLECINTSIVFWALMITFEERIDSDLVFFILYLVCGFYHELLYLKKLYVHTITMLTGETYNERQMQFKLHYKHDKQYSMMERMQGMQPKLINPFNKGIIRNIIEFYLPMFSCCIKKGKISINGVDLMAPRVHSSKGRKSQKLRLRDQQQEEIEMTNTTIDMDEESKLDNEGTAMIEKQNLTPQQQLDKEAKKFDIDTRKFDIDYLLANSPFKVYKLDEIVDWSQIRIYSILQIPSHPSYEQMYNEIKKFMPNMLAQQIRQEQFRRAQAADPQFQQRMMMMNQQQMMMRTPGGNVVVIEGGAAANQPQNKANQEQPSEETNKSDTSEQKNGADLIIIEEKTERDQVKQEVQGRHQYRE